MYVIYACIYIVHIALAGAAYIHKNKHTEISLTLPLSYSLFICLLFHCPRNIIMMSFCCCCGWCCWYGCCCYCFSSQTNLFVNINLLILLNFLIFALFLICLVTLRLPSSPVQNPAIADVYTEHSCAVNVAKYSPSGFYIASGGKFQQCNQL